MDNMFEKIMKLPLFQGVSQERIASLVEKMPFHFLKFADGEQVIEKGEECTHLKFVISGCAKVVFSSDVARMSVTYIVDAPNVIAPDYLFGRYTSYPCDVFADGQCGILQIRKSDYIDILQSDKVFLFNILNYLSRNSQNRTMLIMKQSHGLIVERLVNMILATTNPASREITLDFKQKDLCLILGARRSSLVNALEELKKKGVVDYSVSRITVSDRRALVDLVKNQ